MNHPRQRKHGFSLIELMVAVTIIAIMTAIALPSYAAYIQRSRVGDALAPLAQYRLQMEQASQDNGNYGVTACAVAPPNNTPYFRFGCALATGGQGFVATATGYGQMTAYVFSVDELGAQKTSAFPGAASLPAPCWLTRTGDC
jgi:type IV pilus assembly protein PilE